MRVASAHDVVRRPLVSARPEAVSPIEDDGARPDVASSAVGLQVGLVAALCAGEAAAALRLLDRAGGQCWSEMEAAMTTAALLRVTARLGTLPVAVAEERASDDAPRLPNRTVCPARRTGTA